MVGYKKVFMLLAAVVATVSPYQLNAMKRKASQELEESKEKRKCVETIPNISPEIWWKILKKLTFQELLTAAQTCTIWHSLAQRLIKHHAPYFQHKLFGRFAMFPELFIMFDKRIQQGSCITQAVAIAQQCMQSDRAYVLNFSYDLFKTLVKNGHALNEATSAAQLGMQSDDFHVLNQSRELFKILIKKGHAVNEATSAAQLGMQSNNFHVLSNSQGLFTILIEEGHAVNEAISTAQVGMQSNNINDLNHNLHIFETLVNEGHALNEATSAAQLGMQSNNAKVIPSTLWLYQALVNKGHALDEATFAAQLINDNHADLIWIAQRLTDSITSYENHMIPWNANEDVDNLTTQFRCCNVQ